MNSAAKWWHDTVFYEIYIASFQDGNDDGIGDFIGLTSRLDYLQELGVRGLWITPFYPSPKVDNGYDVSDYFDVDPDFGSLSDFDHFLQEAHKRDIKVIVDMVLNHVSTEHHWFKEAIASPDNKYRDYFFFKDEPNNWESFFGGSAWEKEPRGDQYYYHKFAPEQVDLNWTNKAVADDVMDVLKFWLDRGVDGYRFDVINFLTCDGIGSANPKDAQGQQIHRNDIDQKGIFSCIEKICDFSRNYGNSLGKECFLVGEIGHDTLLDLAPYQSEQLLDVVFNFNLGSIPEFDISNVYEQLVAMERELSGPATLFFNSHDMPRSMTRLCNNDLSHAEALAALALTAKGICFLYFGEEIGMPNFMPKNINEIRDICAINHYELALKAGNNPAHAFVKSLQESRDKSRLYMQWDNTKFAGFSTKTPWIGSENPEQMTTVKDQINDSNSLWHWYHKLIQIRTNNPALTHGNYDGLSLNEGMLNISRSWENQNINVLINFSTTKRKINVAKSHEILASKRLAKSQSDWLLPYGILITSELKNVC